jgi:muramidase (phage lysozyme)
MLPNQAAFLAMLRHSEGTDRAPDPYRVVYGFALTLSSLRDHPAITGEWLGVQTPYGHTSAAGAYQIERLTWLECKAALHLMDFTGTSQDDAALFLIKQKGALDLVNAGDFASAVELCHGIWASLPGSTSGQPQRSIAMLTDFYIGAGGVLA